MDITAKKNELMNWLLQINDESKLKKIIALKSVLDKEVVAHTISSNPIDRNNISIWLKKPMNEFHQVNTLRLKI